MRLPQPKAGHLLDDQPTGIPLFFEVRQPRVVTADPWAFFDHCSTNWLARPELARAEAYVEQAHDFFQAAENPQISSRPLLYYYSFLNLTKVALLNYGVPIPLRLTHGIRDPGANIKQRIRMTGQQITTENVTASRNRVFPELWKLLGGHVLQTTTLRVVDVLYQVPSIHRTFSRVSKRRSLLVPISRTEFLGDGAHVWPRLVLSRKDRDVSRSLPSLRGRPEFRARLTQVQSPKTEEIWFEGDPVAGIRRGVETAIRRIAKDLYELPFTTILTTSGYRTYLANLPSRDALHPLIAIYASMFYLGSITRYKPDVFDKILAGGYAWVVEEFLATAPMQFLYILASVLAGCEVVRPYAALRL